MRVVKRATSRPCLHRDLDVELSESQDGSVIGIPTLGGVDDTVWKHGVNGTLVPQDPNPPPPPAPQDPNPPPPPPPVLAAAPAAAPEAVDAPAAAAATPAANGNTDLDTATILQLTGNNARAIGGNANAIKGLVAQGQQALEVGKQALEVGKQALKRCDQNDSRLDGHDAKLDEQDGRINNLQAEQTQYGKELKNLKDQFDLHVATAPRHAAGPHQQQPPPDHHLFQLTNVGSGTVASPQASSKPVPNIVPPSTGAGASIIDQKPAARPSRSTKPVVSASTTSDKVAFALATTSTIVGNPPRTLTTFPLLSDPVLIEKLLDHDKRVVEASQGSASTSEKMKNRGIKDYCENKTAAFFNVQLRLRHIRKPYKLNWLDVKFLISSVSDCPKVVGVTFRGQSYSDRSRWYFDKLVESLREKTSFTEPAFLSSSAKPFAEFDHYAAKPVRIAILSKTGRYIRPYSPKKLQKEWEVSLVYVYVICPRLASLLLSPSLLFHYFDTIGFVPSRDRVPNNLTLD